MPEFATDPDDPYEPLARKLERIRVEDPALKQSLTEIAAEIRGVAATAKTEPKRPPPWIRE